MPVTRSKNVASARVSKPERPAQKAAIPKLAPEALHQALSPETAIASENLTSPKKAVSSKIPPSPRKPKRHIESAFAHIATPHDLRLPESYVQVHSPAFVEAMNGVLKVDPSLYPAAVSNHFPAFSSEEEPIHEAGRICHYWYSLIRSVISQQVSGSAANAIRGRFEQLFDGVPTPEKALGLSVEAMRSAGLSGMKVKYVVSISEAFCSPECKLTSEDFYNAASPEEIVEELTRLKGIGEWSARMFALFTLKDMDIFAYDDLGVARGVARYLEVRPEILAEVKTGVHAVEELKSRLKRKSKFSNDKSSKRDWVPLHDEYVKFLALRFAPHRSAFMSLMWRLSATNIEALESAKSKNTHLVS